MISIDKYRYGLGFDRKGTFSVGNGFGKNYIIFEVDMSSSVHVGNKTKNILILGEGPTQGLDDTTLIAEKNIQLILLKIIKNSVEACIITEQTVIHLLMVQKLLNSKQKIVKLKQHHYV